MASGLFKEPQPRKGSLRNDPSRWKRTGRRRYNKKKKKSARARACKNTPEKLKRERKTSTYYNRKELLKKKEIPVDGWLRSITEKEEEKKVHGREPEGLTPVTPFVCLSVIIIFLVVVVVALFINTKSFFDIPVCVYSCAWHCSAGCDCNGIFQLYPSIHPSLLPSAV
jgi:hypothetical protein